MHTSLLFAFSDLLSFILTVGRLLLRQKLQPFQSQRNNEMGAIRTLVGHPSPVKENAKQEGCMSVRIWYDITKAEPKMRNAAVAVPPSSAMNQVIPTFHCKAQ